MAEARKMSRVSYDEMLELASLGAGVMHSRSIEFGKKFDVPIHVRNSASFSDEPGTMIGAESESADRAVSGAALTKNEARITIAGVPDQPGTSLRDLLEAGRRERGGRHDRAERRRRRARPTSRSPCSKTSCRRRSRPSKKAAEELGAEGVSHDASVSKVSIVGLGMATQTGVADRMFRALADEGINIQAITTSEIKISVLVKREQALAALRAVHAEFELDQPPRDRVAFGEQPARPASADAVDIVARLQRMEDLTIESVSLDESQAQMTLFDVPDRPGIVGHASSRRSPRENILVDMIVQSIGRDGLADISFTVPRK